MRQLLPQRRIRFAIAGKRSRTHDQCSHHCFRLCMECIASTQHSNTGLRSRVTAIAISKPTPEQRHGFAVHVRDDTAANARAAESAAGVAPLAKNSREYALKVGASQIDASVP